MIHPSELNQSSVYRSLNRPQRGIFLLPSFNKHLLTIIYIVDGPALRATALIAYGNWLVANSNSSYATSTVWPIIKLDLDYVASSWNLTG